MQLLSVASVTVKRIRLLMSVSRLHVEGFSFVDFLPMCVTFLIGFHTLDHYCNLSIVKSASLVLIL